MKRVEGGSEGPTSSSHSASELNQNTMNTRQILTIGFTLLSVALFAQGAPPATPIDGGLGLLLAGGAAYGIKQIKKKRG